MQIQSHPLPIRCPHGVCDFKRYLLPDSSQELIEDILNEHDDVSCLEVLQRLEDEQFPED